MRFSVVLNGRWLVLHPEKLHDIRFFRSTRSDKYTTPVFKGLITKSTQRKRNILNNSNFLSFIYLFLEYYKIKSEQIEIDIIEQKRKKEEAINLGNVEMMDIKLIQSELTETRNSHTTLKTEYINLIKSLEQLEETREINRFHAHPKLIALEQEFVILQTQYNQYQTANSNLHENNISLQFEINTYRRLLEGNKKILKI